MDTSFLKGFLLTVETGSMSEAARRLDITPAAIAQQIRSLERTLEVKLVSRAGRTVKPTEAGHLLAANARGLVENIDNLKHIVKTDPFGGQLRLGSINTALLSFLPQTLKIFSSLFPQTRISIRSGHSHELISLLEQDELDAVICIHPHFAFSKSMRWRAFRNEPLVMLAPAASLTSDPAQLLNRYPLIRYDRNLAGGKQADQYLNGHRINPTECVELSSILAIALMVECGLGVSIVPDINSRLVNGLSVRKIPLDSSSVQRTIGILSQRHSFKNRLIDHLFECYQKLAPQDK